MNNTIQLSCPSEILISLHADAEQFSELMKLQTAIYLFKEHKISSGTAANWLNISRVNFLHQAMEAGAVLLDDNDDDFRRETSLL
jgi:predicted HTH domain antitoxin